MEYRKIHIGSLTLKRYADLDYDEWYALAEFVDNSLHSFLNNKKVLERDCKITSCDVRISIPKLDSGEEIHISDNAGGIHPQDFHRLYTLGEPKETADHQLSEFGMGMKTASVWFGKRIEIETKHHANDKAYQIVMDIEKLGEDDEITEKEVIPSSNLRGYTKIKIKNLNRGLGRKKKKIKESLSSIYRKFIESGELIIRFEDEVLDPINIELAERGGAPLKKDFVITMDNGKECKGWIGVMKKGATKYSGFSIYRSNRLVQGYPENAWLPAELYGSEGGSNSRKNQVMIGELDMTQFNVAHTKNKINFIGEEEGEFREKLKDACWSIAKVSGEKKKDTSTKEHEDRVNVVVARESIKEHFSEPKSVDLKSLDITRTIVKPTTPGKVKEIFESESEPYMHFEEMRDAEGIEKEVFVYHFIDNHQPYMILDTIEDNLVVCVNVAHPYYQNIYENGTADQIREYHLNCIFDALSEIHSKQKYGSFQPDDVRLTKDLFLKRWIEFIGV